MEVGNIAKDKLLKTVSNTVAIIAAVVTIFVGLNTFVDSDENTDIVNDEGTVIVGDNNSYDNSNDTIINKVISFFMNSNNKKEENIDPTATPNEEYEYSENSENNKRSEISVPEEDKSEGSIYDKDFSLIGKVVEKSYFSSKTNKVKDGVLLIDIPDNERKYYQINVTTDDPESEVAMYEYYTYDYKYKADKFSDFSFASGIIAGNDSLSLGKANKMKDINRIVYICPISASDCLPIVRSKGIEQMLIDRNLSIQLEIPVSAVVEKEDGDTVISNGHITILEVDKEDVGNHHYRTIGWSNGFTEKGK